MTQLSVEIHWEENNSVWKYSCCTQGRVSDCFKALWKNLFSSLNSSDNAHEQAMNGWTRSWSALLHVYVYTPVTTRGWKEGRERERERGRERESLHLSWIEETEGSIHGLGCRLEYERSLRQSTWGELTLWATLFAVLCGGITKKHWRSTKHTLYAYI